MLFELQILALAYLGFLWLTCAFEAYNSLSGGRIRRLETQNPKLAARLEKWLEDEDAFRMLFKLLLFLLTALMAACAFSLATRLAGGVRPAYLALILAAAILMSTIFAEILARAALLRFDLTLLRFSMPPLSLLAYTVFMPFFKLAKNLGNKLGLKRESSDEEESPRTTAADEILSFVENAGEDGAPSDLEESEKRMIRGIFDLSEMSVREIMTPRVDLFAIPQTASPAEAKALFVSSGHSRIPVYGRTVDEIKGILYAKDFLDEAKISSHPLLQLARKPIFIPETKAVSELLDEIKRTRNHFAVIIDEYGGTSGVVTFEDIIEEIVGEVHDEYDTEEDVKSRPQLMPDGSVVLDARTLLNDVNDIMESSIPIDGSADTVGGYACAQLGRIPEEGETFKIPGGLVCSVLKADKRKILQLKLTLAPEEE